MRKWIELAVILLLLAVVVCCIQPAYGLIDVQKLPKNIYIDMQRCNQSMYIVTLHELNIYWDRSYKWSEDDRKQAKNGAIVYIVNDLEGCA